MSRCHEFGGLRAPLFRRFHGKRGWRYVVCRFASAQDLRAMLYANWLGVRAVVVFFGGIQISAFP